MHYITALFLTASLLGMVAATGNPVHRYTQLCAWGQPGCRASNLDEEGIYGDCIDLCVPLDNYDTFRSVSIESVESGYTRICSVILNGLRFLLTNASVVNTNIGCTNWCAMTEM
ncbi:hypothetical protein N7497_012213 [Penicillium chrysogenum]|nr:hypothetical protein N7497_012213 [Penicillium chrysogenum]